MRGLSMASTERRTEKGRVRHGVYRVLQRLTSEVLDGREREAVAVRKLTAWILGDLPGDEEPTTRQSLLAVEAARKAVVLSKLYGHTLKKPVTRKRLHTLLGEHALAWSNSMRLDLGAVDGRGVDEGELLRRLAKRAQHRPAGGARRPL